METILGQKTVVETTELDVATVNVTPPTQARVHGIASASAEDDGAQVQIETATVVADEGITTSGNAEVMFTGAGVTGSPITKSVALLDTDDADGAATTIAAALDADANISAKYAVTAVDNTVIATAVAAATNDATLNISIDNDTCAGITTAATSANTQNGSTGSGALSVLVKGLGSDYKPLQETVILQGTTSVNTVNSYAFINEIKVASGAVNVGNITATAATDSTVSYTVPAGMGVGAQAFYMAADDGGVYQISRLYADSVNATANAYTTIKVKVLEDSGVWITKRMFKLDDNKTYYRDYINLDLKARSIVKVTAVASGGSANVNVMMDI